MKVLNFRSHGKKRLSDVLNVKTA